jgi:hypothetical protein
LELHPKADSCGIKCSLFHVKLSDCRNYEALSYVWGSATERVSISCNGRQLDITSTLASALQLLSKGSESRILWIDQICINQDDNEEKTRQVALMRDIFQRSERTIAWLGDSSLDSDLAIDYCSRLLLSIFSDKSVATLDSPDQAPLRLFDPRLKPSSNEPSRAEAVALTRLLKRPWFSRVWVVQEVGVSDEVVAMCGTKVPCDRPS